MKKILFIIPSLEVGGTVSSLASLMVYLKDKYIVDVFVLAHEGKKNQSFNDAILAKNRLTHAYNTTLTKSSGIEWLFVFIIKLLKRFFIKSRFDFESWLYRVALPERNNHDYDYVVGFQEGAATKCAALYENVTKFAWVHCDYSRYPMAGKEYNLYHQFNEVICVSSYTANSFKSIYPIFAEKTCVIHNILNVDYILNNSKEAIGDFTNISGDFTIISVGRINTVKRFSVIPALSRELLNRGCKFRWYILGPNYSDKCYKELMHNIHYHGVADYVIYLGNKENPFPYYLRSNLLVSLSSSEACPMIFNEAKVLGIPVVSANFGSSYEFIKDGINGKIVAIDDMADTLFGLITSAEDYRQLKNNVMTSSYSNTEIIKSLYALFSE